MKVKVIYDYHYGQLESRINDFIKDKEIVNISLSESDRYNYVTALILYKEDKQ